MTSPTAREKADGLMDERTHAPPHLRVVSKMWRNYPEHVAHRDAIAAALLSAREAGRAEMREDAAKVLDDAGTAVARSELDVGYSIACDTLAERIRSLPLKKDEG